MNKNNEIMKGNRRGMAHSATALLLAAALVGLSTGTPVLADQSTAAMTLKPEAAMNAQRAPFVKESLHQMTATVEAIAMDTREVTLRGKDGTIQTIKVGPEARNLDQVKVGDNVTVSYYESLAAQMRLHDKPNAGFQTAAGAIKAARRHSPLPARLLSTQSTFPAVK